MPSKREADIVLLPVKQKARNEGVVEIMTNTRGLSAERRLDQ